jgi:hypothetical protein
MSRRTKLAETKSIKHKDYLSYTPLCAYLYAHWKLQFILYLDVNKTVLRDILSVYVEKLFIHVLYYNCMYIFMSSSFLFYPFDSSLF